MNRLLTAAFIALTALVSVYMYFLAEEVRSLEGDLARINRTLIDERENINVLEAEWAFVARPEVLQDKAQRHLALAPVAVDQIISFDQLPRRQDRLLAPLAGMPDADVASKPGLDSKPRSLEPQSNAIGRSGRAALVLAKIQP
jgi:hypothetical protein